MFANFARTRTVRRIGVQIKIDRRHFAAESLVRIRIRNGPAPPNRFALSEKSCCGTGKIHEHRRQRLQRDDALATSTGAVRRDSPAGCRAGPRTARRWFSLRWSSGCCRRSPAPPATSPRMVEFRLPIGFVPGATGACGRHSAWPVEPAPPPRAIALLRRTCQIRTSKSPCFTGSARFKGDFFHRASDLRRDAAARRRADRTDGGPRVRPFFHPPPRQSPCFRRRHERRYQRRSLNGFAWSRTPPNPPATTTAMASNQL